MLFQLPSYIIITQNMNQNHTKSSKPQHAKEISENSQSHGPIKRHSSDQQQIDESTIKHYITTIGQKIKADDEVETKKNRWKKQAGPGVKQCQQSFAGGKVIKIGEAEAVQVSKDEEVEKILAQKPLSERLDLSFLSREQRLPISFEHMELLKKMSYIDSTLKFLTDHRNEKSYSFESVRKNLIQTANMFVSLEHLKQLLFIDGNCYNVFWRLNDSTKKHEIRIKLPQFQSLEKRKHEMKCKITKFLIDKEGEFIAKNKINPSSSRSTSWVKGFQVSQVTIPAKSLPVHPQLKGSDLREFADEEIDKTPNPYLKYFFKQKKKEEVGKEMSADAVRKMIRENVPAQEITERVMTAIRKRELEYKKEMKEMERDRKKIEMKVLENVFNQMYMLYVDKKISGMHKTTLMPQLKKILKYGDDAIERCVEVLIEDSETGFLKEVYTSKKQKILQMNKSKYREMKANLQTILAKVNEEVQ